MGDLMNRSFKFDGKRSISFDRNNFTRFNTSHLASEMGSSFAARFTAYEKLSDSMRLIDAVESGNNHSRWSMNGAWRFVTKLFFLKKAEGGDSSDTRRRSAKRMTVRSSSWRPDRNRRWPVQGW